jgi:hypothetical protein
MQLTDTMLNTHIYGRASDWEKHDIQGHISFVKEVAVHDAEVKAKIAERFYAMGFVPMFFREHGKEFVALEGTRETAHYGDIEAAFVQQILAHAH